MEINELTGKVIRIAMDVHTNLGPGLLESAYKECLFYKLRKSALQVEKEKPVPLVFEEVRLAQVLTYLKVGQFKIGLLINFNVLHLRDGIKRVVNNL